MQRLSHSLTLSISLSPYSTARNFLTSHRSSTNYTLIGTMGLDANDIGWESTKVIGKAILTKISEIGVQKGTDKATGGGTTVVKIEEELKVAGGPIQLTGTVDVKLSAPLKVDLQSVGTAIAVGILGGWIVVTLVDTVKGLFTGGGGRGGTSDPNGRRGQVP